MYLNFSVIKPLINWKIIPTIISFQSNDLGTQKTSETHPMLATESAAVVGDTSFARGNEKRKLYFPPRCLHRPAWAYNLLLSLQSQLS